MGPGLGTAHTRHGVKWTLALNNTYWDMGIIPFLAHSRLHSHHTRLSYHFFTYQHSAMRLHFHVHHRLMFINIYMFIRVSGGSPPPGVFPPPPPPPPALSHQTFPPPGLFPPVKFPPGHFPPVTLPTRPFPPRIVYTIKNSGSTLLKGELRIPQMVLKKILHKYKNMRK